MKREILKKEINEKEYSIGKLIMKKNDDGINECFLEGNEFKRIAGLINNINVKKTELKILSSQNINDDILTYKLNQLNNEEKEIRQYQEILYQEKNKFNS